MELRIVNKIAAQLASKPGVTLFSVARALGVAQSQILPELQREIRNGNMLNLTVDELKLLADNAGDPALTKIVDHKLANEDKMKPNKVNQLSELLETLQKRLHDRRAKGKPKSKLVNSKKTKIPGFSTYFQKD
jgi:hypothetical protein